MAMPDNTDMAKLITTRKVRRKKTMTLKEAFRYKNFLKSLTSQVTNAMCIPANIMATTKTHHLHDVNPEAEDKVEEVKTKVTADINAALRMYIATEKLTEAIETAKSSLGFSLDAKIQGNIARQGMAAIIKSVLNNKENESQDTGTAYRFNAEGNQMPYVYAVDVAQTELFNRTEFKNALDDARKTSDTISSKIDTAMVTTEVPYEAPWDVNSTMDDIIVNFADTAAE